MSFIQQTEQACHLVRQPQGLYAISKSARVGCTTSSIAAFLLTKQKVTVVTNSNRLSKEISRQIPKVLGYKPKIAIIPDNTRLCKKTNAALKLKFQFKKNCSLCKYKKKPTHCRYQRLLTEDYDLILLTYQKLQRLLMAASPLLDKIVNSRNVILDEVGTRILASPQAFSLAKTENGKKVERSELLKRNFKDEFNECEEILRKSTYLENRNDNLKVKFWGVAENTLQSIEKANVPGEYQPNILYAIGPKDAVDFWLYITKLTEEGKDTTMLQELYPLILSKKVFITFRNGRTYATPLEDTLRSLRKFCSRFQNGLVFLVDTFHPQGLSYDRIFGRTVTYVPWIDFYETDKAQLILCDRSHLSSNFFIGSRYLQERTEDTIHSFGFDPEETLIICLNKRIAKIIEYWEVGEVTWHRSSLTRGIQAHGKSKIFIIIGPYVPKNSFDSLAYSMPDSYFLEDFAETDEVMKNTKKSMILKRNYETGEFLNSIARIKDPLGKQRTIIITMGLTKNGVDYFINTEKSKSQPQLSRPRSIEPYAKGGLAKDGAWIARFWLDRAEVEIEDLPVVARAIRIAKEKGRAPLSQIFTDEQSCVKQTLLKYVAVLERYGVSIKEVSGGLTFETF